MMADVLIEDRLPVGVNMLVAINWQSATDAFSRCEGPCARFVIKLKRDQNAAIAFGVVAGRESQARDIGQLLVEGAAHFTQIGKDAFEFLQLHPQNGAH